MVALLHPGVYVQEVPSGVRSIEGVPTSTAVFVGETERGPLEPTKILSAGDYARTFGGHLRHVFDAGTGNETAPNRVTMRYAVDLFFQNGGSVIYVLRAASNGAGAANGVKTVRLNGSNRMLEAASPGEWGKRVFALFVTSTDRFRIVLYYALPGGDPRLVEDWDRLSADPAQTNYAGDVLQRSLYIRWVDGAAPVATDNIGTRKILELTRDDFTVASIAATSLVTPSGSTNTNATATCADLASFVLPSLDGIDDAALLVGATERWANNSFNITETPSLYYDTLRSYADNRPKQDLFYIADAPAFDGASSAVQDVKNYVVGATGVTPITVSTFAGLYWPHLRVADPVGPTATSTRLIPSSGAVAGVYARTDARRGVWKAPAGVDSTISGMVSLSREVIDGEQDDLNPAGINVVRPVPGAGTVVWGARTLVPASEWRYVPIRRTAMFLRKSIYNGIQFAVFEPNDTPLWGSLRATIEAFMQTQFRNGAFAGKTANQAYFVKIDSETTTPADQAAGVVNILVGFAPLRPAEFVVVRLSQKTATSA